MDSQPLDRRRNLISPAYFISALLILFAYVDFVLNIWPLNAGEARWRFGAVGVFSSYTGWLLLGYLLLLWFAMAAGHRGLLKAVAVLCLLEAIVLLLATLAFPLDVIQLKNGVPASDLWTFEAAAARTVFKNLLSIVAFFWMALAGFRGSKPEPGSRSRRTEPSPLIVGSDRG
jgi:hypothetical protein